jgi:chromosome segregation ATPase
LESKVAALDREVYDRGEWGKRLDEELSELRQQAVARDEQAGRLQSEKALLEAELSKVECARSEAEKVVRELESKVAALDREVYDRGEWGQRLDRELSELRQQLTLRDEQVGGLKNEKSSLTAELKKMLDDYHALQEKELFIMKDIEQLRAELAQQASALAEISRREVEARDREDACLRRETAREARLQQTEVALTCAEEQLIQAQNTLNAVLADAEDKLRWAASLDTELNRFRMESSALKVIQDRQIEQLQDKVSRMQRSVSWNLTAPLRALRRVILNR